MQATEYNFFASTHGILSRIDHISGQKQNINKFKKTNGIFSGHNATGIEINYKKKKTIKNYKYIEDKQHTTK